VHPATADVERAQHAVEVEAAEAEPALGVLEGDEASRRPGVEDRGLDLSDSGLACTLELLPHLFEAAVRVVDVSLFDWELLVHPGAKSEG
jgi:hypothetical protein